MASGHALLSACTLLVHNDHVYLGALAFATSHDPCRLPGNAAVDPITDIQ
jgi:hypothetical protein